MAFPPTGPQSQQVVTRSYAYKQYDDDDDITAFFDAYNGIAQTYVDWFNNLNLPVYTEIFDAVAPGLLDFVGPSLYGISRPSLFSDVITYLGPFNTYAIDEYPAFGEDILTDAITSGGFVTDDIYKRVITWHTYRGDGFQTTVDWLKQRINRFLNGANGTDYSGDRSQISVLFGPGDSLAITIVIGRSTLVHSAVYDEMGFNDTAMNETNVQVTTLPTPALASVLQQAINDGVLEMPSQYTVTCQIGVMGI
jgi:hypothetical protein